jgi:RNA polymerase sigma-32 factor
MAREESSESFRRNRRFISTAMQVPLLSAADERALATRWRDDGDEAALHKLVGAYLRLAIATAGKFRQYGLSQAELVQEGAVGLMQAAARFDPDREVRFSTYAGWWVRAAMQEYVLRNWSIVRSGSSAAQKSLFFNLRWMRAKIDPTGGAVLGHATRNAIARELKVKPKDVDAMAQRLAGRDQSLNQPIGEEAGDSWEDLLTDDAPTPEDVTMARRDRAVRRRWLGAALGELNDRERLIIEARRLAEDRITLEELGGRLGITKERVRQIEHKAFEKLSANVVKLAQAAGEPAVA